MIAVDTNVVVRLLVRDDDAQTERARSLVVRASKAGRRLYVADVAVCELLWVLDVSYGFGRPQIAEALEQLLSAQELVFESGELLRESLGRYRSGRGDFADYLIAAKGRAAGCESTATFDRKLLREPGFVLP